jgi:saposin
VDQYAPQIIQLLIQKENPQAVCTKLKICTALTQPVAVTPQCAICEFLVKEVEAELAKNKTQSEIIADLDKVCAKLGAIKAECAAVVGQYGPQIIQMLMAKENPQTVCTQLKLCTGQRTPVSVTPQCAICEFLVKEAEAQLAANKTESQIVAHLEAVCSKLGAIKTECKAVVDQYAVQIIQLLIQKENPQAVCTKIGLCKTLQVGTTPECAICEFLIKEVETMLENNKTESEIEAELDKICNHLGSIKTECAAVVNQYTPQIISALVHKENPQTVCTKVGACKSAKSFRSVADFHFKVGMRVH